jgi:hypothetical protein
MPMLWLDLLDMCMCKVLARLLRYYSIIRGQEVWHRQLLNEQAKYSQNILLAATSMLVSGMSL